MATTFVSTDWQRLAMVALLVDRFFEKPSAALFAEIRLNESLLGATVVDRNRLGVRIAPEQPEAPDVVDEIMARRQRIAAERGDLR